MGRHRVYTGAYTKCHHTHIDNSRSDKDFKRLVLKYLNMVYSSIISSYLPIVIVLIVLILSLFLPNKVNKNNDLDVMKKVLDHMTKEVERAEVACLTAANEVHCFHSNLCNEETETTRDLRDLSVCTSRSLFSTHSEPVQVEKKIGILRKIFPQRNISRKEIAIMSIVYTDSFNSQDGLTGLESIL